VTDDIAAAAAADIVLIATPAQNLREAVAALAPYLAATKTRHRLRQGDRARHPPIHDRGDRGSRAQRDTRDAVGAEFCRGCGARPAHGRHPGSEGRDACTRAGCRHWDPRPSGPYHTTDVRGVEIGGAAKNVLAIAAGIVVGKEIGRVGARSADTRGFSETDAAGACLRRAQRRPMAGLSGLGDLILNLFKSAVAQFRARHRARARRGAAAR